MFRFLLGITLGAGGYWAWQSFGRDLMGMGSDSTSYGSYGSTTYGASTYGSPAGSSYSSPAASSTPSTTPAASSGDNGANS